MFTPPLVVHSRAMQDTARVARMFARSRRPLLLRGPAGSGKRTLAAHVHHWSSEGRATLVDCADPSPEHLDALQCPWRWLREHPAGSVILAGVDALPRPLQRTLASAIPMSTARVIATARTRGRLNRRLLDAFRLQLEVPGLDQRRPDVTSLALNVANELAYPVRCELTATARHYLTSYDWPGNVSELRLLLRCALDAVIPERGAQRVACPSCGQRYKASRACGGHSLRCRRCRTRVVVPVPARGAHVITGTDLLGAREHPLLAQAEEAGWFLRGRPRVLGGRRSREVEVKVRSVPRPDAVAAIPVGAADGFELCARPRRVVRALPSPEVVRALPADAEPAAEAHPRSALPGHAPLPDPAGLPAIPAPRAHPKLIPLWLPPCPPPALFPERRLLPRLVLACARQLRFGREGKRALRAGVTVFLLALLGWLKWVRWGL